ncbi:MAG: NosD domain-containing protein [Promethearchaeota archaeon]
MVKSKIIVAVAVTLFVMGFAIGITNLSTNEVIFYTQKENESTFYTHVPLNSESHDPIYINGNVDLSVFIAEEGQEGDGSALAPYIIEDFTITAEFFTNGIHIQNTDAFLIIRNCTIVGDGDNYASGIYLDNTQNVVITQNDINGVSNGIEMWGCFENIVTMNRLTYCNSGMEIWVSDAIRVEENSMNYNKLIGIMFLGTMNSLIQGNDLSRNEGTAIYFEDGSDFNIITENSIDFNGQGFSICFSGWNTVSNNGFQYNSYDAISFLFACDNILTGNQLYGSGIYLDDGSYGNEIDLTNKLNDKSIHYYEYTQDIILSGNVDVGQVILLGCDNILVENLNFIDSSSCITILESSNCSIDSNIFTDCGEGIIITSSTMIGVSYNILECSGRSAVALMGSYNVTLSKNQMLGNGIWIYNSYQNQIDTTNTVNEKNVRYYEDKSGIVLKDDPNVGQVILVNCENVWIEGLELSEVPNGILLQDSNNCDIIENVILNCTGGIRLVNSENISIIGNEANHNRGMGIQLLRSNFVQIIDNKVWNNEVWGIAISSANYNNISGNSVKFNGWNGMSISRASENQIMNNEFANNTEYGIMIVFDVTANLFYLNDFTDNGESAVLDMSFGSVNLWDNGSFGNYWGEEYLLQNPDATNDGMIWNIPFKIDEFGEGVDNFPLVNSAYQEPVQEQDTTAPEFLDIPEDFALRGRYRNITLSWTAFDEDPAYYVILINGTEVIGATNWTNEEPSIFLLPYLFFRADYNITIIVWDGSGNSAQDSVIFTLESGIKWIWEFEPEFFNIYIIEEAEQTMNSGISFFIGIVSSILIASVAIFMSTGLKKTRSLT